jgi:hypothetical protein
MVHTQAAKEQPHLEKSRQRSPNYPAISLRAAIEKTRLLYQADKKAGALVDAALKHMGFSRKHGQAMAVLSAVKKYGLVDDVDGRVVPTQRAIDILVFPDTDERRLRAIRESALSPAIYRELYERYKSTGIPSDETLRAELIADKHFNPNAVEDFIQDFKDTLIFSGMMDPIELSLRPEDKLEMTDSASQPSVQTSGIAPKPIAMATKEISLPVGITEEGQAIFAHVRFDAPLKKEMLVSLKHLLDAVEKTLN